MIRWKRPSGSFIETGDSPALIKYAVENGWIQAEKVVNKPADKPVKVKKKAKKVSYDNSTPDHKRRG